MMMMMMMMMMMIVVVVVIRFSVLADGYPSRGQNAPRRVAAVGKLGRCYADSR